MPDPSLFYTQAIAGCKLFDSAQNLTAERRYP